MTSQGTDMDTRTVDWRLKSAAAAIFQLLVRLKPITLLVSFELPNPNFIIRS